MLRSTLFLFLLLLLASGAGATEAAKISEETPPTTCGNNLVSGLTCSGKYCDNLKPLCGRTFRDLYQIGWSGWVSEEGSAKASCYVSNRFERGDWAAGEPAFITGFACRGKYCDNVALECVALIDAFPSSYGGGDCRWTAWVSEETPTVRFPNNYGAISMECRGKYCDDKRFRVCPIRAR